MAASNAAPWKCGTNSAAADVTSVVTIASVSRGHSSFASAMTRQRYSAGVRSSSLFVPRSPRMPPSAVSRFFREKQRMQQSKSHVLHRNPPNRRPFAPATRRKPHRSHTWPTTRSWNWSSCAWKSLRSTPVLTVQLATSARSATLSALTHAIVRAKRATVRGTRPGA